MFCHVEDGSRALLTLFGRRSSKLSAHLAVFIGRSGGLVCMTYMFMIQREDACSGLAG